MASNEADDTSIVECDPSPIFTPSTTTNATISDMEELNIADTPSSSSIPAPGNTYVICSVSTGKVITFQHGEVILGPQTGYGVHWECSTTDGWIKLRCPASWMFLGFDAHFEFKCSAKKLLGNDFCVRQNTDGSYMLLALWFQEDTTPKLSPVGITVQNEIEWIEVIEDWNSETIKWEFIKVL